MATNYNSDRKVTETFCYSFSSTVKAEKELSVEDPKFINALEEENKKLEQRITVFKSNIMMVTSFDAVTTQV